MEDLLQLVRETAMVSLLKDNFVHLDFYQGGNLYYHLVYGGYKWQFPVPIDDAGTGVFKTKDKAILFMRWIRKAKESEEIYLEKIN